MPTWPDDLFAFGFIPDTDSQLKRLADDAEPEDWAYHYTPSDDRLFNSEHLLLGEVLQAPPAYAGRYVACHRSVV